LETGLREALLRLNTTGGIQLPNSPASSPPSPTGVNFLEHSHDLTYNITQALKELQSMKEEREKGLYTEQHEDSSHHSDHETSTRRDCAESIHTASSAKTEDLATPLTSPSNSPQIKTLFLPTDLSQPQLFPPQTDRNINFYQVYYDRQTGVSNMPPPIFSYDDQLSLGWLDSVALDGNYDFSTQNNEFSLTNL
jgi:hypothetical protein